MAFAHFQPAPRCCGTDFPFGFVRQRPSLSSRVSWRRICLRSRTCSTGGSNFLYHAWTLSFSSFVYFVIDVRSVGSRQSMLFDCLSVPPGQSLFFVVRACSSPVVLLRFYSFSLFYPVIIVVLHMICFLFLLYLLCIFNLYLRLYIKYFILFFLICN